MLSGHFGALFVNQVWKTKSGLCVKNSAPSLVQRVIYTSTFLSLTIRTLKAMLHGLKKVAFHTGDAALRSEVDNAAHLFQRIVFDTYLISVVDPMRKCQFSCTSKFTQLHNF